MVEQTSRYASYASLADSDSGHRSVHYFGLIAGRALPVSPCSLARNRPDIGHAIHHWPQGFLDPPGRLANRIGDSNGRRPKLRKLMVKTETCTRLKC
jgi:hypothetical protein